LRRSLFGYRRADVHEALTARDAALGAMRDSLEGAGTEIDILARELDVAAHGLAEREGRIAELEQVATQLSERVVAREQELKLIRAELAEAQTEGAGDVMSISSIARELSEVRKQARGQATRMRLRALRDAAELADRIGEVSRSPVEMRERLLEALAEAIARMGVDPAELGITGSGAEPVADEHVEMPAGEENGHGEIATAELFNGLVEVEIGPLRDFSQLLGFEDAARSIGGAREIAVRRFSEGRATVAMTLGEPVELLRELEERCDLDFSVRDARDGRLVLDVGDEPA
jgi:hypothetical protein